MFHLSTSPQPYHNLRNIWITKILSLFLYSNTGRLGEASCCGIPAPFDWGFPQSRLANRRMERVYRETILGERWTINDTESWHRRLKAIILKSHPTVESFCSDLMGEWGFISMMIEMVLAGASKKDLTIKLKDSKTFEDTSQHVGRGHEWFGGIINSI